MIISIFPIWALLIICNLLFLLLQSDVDMGDSARDLALRAEALQRQREPLLTSPHSIMNAMRGGPPSLVPPPTSHIPFLPPSSQMPPTPGSAGSGSSSGNGNRTPNSHTPEPSQNQQPWSFEEQFKQVNIYYLFVDITLFTVLSSSFTFSGILGSSYLIILGNNSRKETQKEATLFLCVRLFVESLVL